MENVGGVYYLPVMGPSDEDPLALELSPNVMLNVMRPLPDKDLNTLAGKNIICCDSGGFQIIKALDDGKIVDVGPMLRNRMGNETKVLTIGTIANCIGYNRLNSNMAFMIDYPSGLDDSDEVYEWKLSQSIIARDMLIRAAPELCPDTQMIIALQPRNSHDVQDYFERISLPQVKIYGYPVVNSVRPREMPYLAYVLSYLYSKDIKHIHLLGSSAPCIIFIIVYARLLGMYDRITFDSTTWKQTQRNRRSFLDPLTLTPKPDDNKCLSTMADLRLILRAYGVQIDKIVGDDPVPRNIIVKEGIGYYNIRVIQYFVDEMQKIAQAGELQQFILKFPKYGKEKKHIFRALDILDHSRRHGHEDMVARFSQSYDSVVSSLAL